MLKVSTTRQRNVLRLQKHTFQEKTNITVLGRDDGCPVFFNKVSHTHQPDSLEDQAQVLYPAAPTTAANANTHPNLDHLYPNPGHLGLSSHVAIFNQIFPDNQQDEAFVQSPSKTSLGTSGSSFEPDKHPTIRRAAEILKSVVVAGYHLWQRLGNVISSTMALGYHENLENKDKAPLILIELRKTAFSRIYSADKNVSLFLGRPLRFSKRFAVFQVPDSRLPLDGESLWQYEPLAPAQWDPDSAMNYRAESRWSALCASIKEDIIELLFDPTRNHSTSNMNNLQVVADAQWNALPERFRLEAGVKPQTEDPFECDFMISIRLNYLHIIFLLHRLALERLSEPSEPLVKASIEMLSLSVDAIILRDELSNSGTRLSWKIAHYGLPATGILLLAFLKPHPIPLCLQVARSQVLQNLAVLAAEVGRGTVVRADDPNYELLHKATQTIHRFLDFIHNGQAMDAASQILMQAPEEPLWVQQLGQDLLESDVLFWQGIAEHPSLYNYTPLLASEEQVN
ncbi:hypothetical protein FPCIR_6768 [Fusarium pseudocircinatum]|uniref:Transcription factor domain-containing protein n=1 Tax=Fusarium pseudocircinatum TaxID=56676 RepID=A0A8H5P418_9HYPO|nr:hypothetical protein FPCIR_6768 [Fusarium pseudocircinatum]